MGDHTHAHQFPDTRWTLIARSTEAEDAVRQEALSEICELYWPPVYAFVRHKGCSPHDAEDLTQGFFASLLRRDDLGKVDATKGKLRTFLLVSVKHFIANEWKRSARKKRGGDKVILSCDHKQAEALLLSSEPADQESPDTVFQREWVITVLRHVLGELGERYRKDGKGDLFRALSPGLTPGGPSEQYATLANQLGMTESAVKTAAFRLRERYRDLLRAAIAATLGPGEDVDLELRELMSLFA